MVPNLHGIAFSCPIGQHGKLVPGPQLRLLDELPDHIGRHVTVDRIHNADFIRFKFILSLLYHLRNAEQFRIRSGQLAGDIQAVARSGKIKDKALVFFPPHDVSESSPEEATVLLITAAPMRFKASRRLILLSVFIYLIFNNYCNIFIFHTSLFPLRQKEYNSLCVRLIGKVIFYKNRECLQR